MSTLRSTCYGGRAGWVAFFHPQTRHKAGAFPGKKETCCNFALNRIPEEARIWLVRTSVHSARSAAVPAAGSGGVPPRENTRSETLHEPAGADARATDPIIVPPEEVRARFTRVKPLKEISVTQRGWDRSGFREKAAVSFAALCRDAATLTYLHPG